MEENRAVPRFVPSLYQVALVAVLGAILIVALAPRMDTDLWWHLRVGAYIAVHHVVPSRDFLSFTVAGHAWTDHEWLAELLFIGLYHLAGMWGPIAFCALVITASFALVYATMLQHGVHRALALFVLVAAYVASVASWGPRIQMLTLFLLALYLLLVQRFVQTQDRRVLVVFPLLMLLWTNLHGGFVIGLVALGLSLAGEALNRRTGRENSLSSSDLRGLAAAFGASCLVTIVNPNGVRQLLYPLTLLTPNAFTNVIQEWASPNFHVPVMMLFEGMLLLLLAAFAVARPRLNWTHLLLVLAFTHLALSQIRDVPLWCVAVAPLLAVYLQQAGQRLAQDYLGGRAYRRRPVSSRLASILNVVLLCLALIAYLAMGSRFVTPRAPAEAERQNFPSGAVSYLQRHRLGPNVFNTYSWGGYLLWRLYPRYRPFIDGRAESVYSASVLQAYLDAYGAAPDWSSLLSRYGVQEVLIQPSVPLAQALAGSPGWRLLYRDGSAVIYARR